MFDFSDIRPYEDSEVRATLSNLIANDELIDMIIGFRFSGVSKGLRSPLRALIRVYLRHRSAKINNVFDFQCFIEKYMRHMIKTTITELSSSGLENLDLSQPHLFMSNHRDIALDPALVNYILHQNGQDTVQIAIGDNLLTKPWVADVMRLNRCFVVKRSATSKREKLNNSKQLSAYILHTLQERGDHIWIAQREGRAKDGADLTNPALISMLTLNKDKQTDFAEYVRTLNIIPVSISYEYDPCDRDKAIELAALQRDGSYQKQEGEDMQSISKGILGQKGRVHLHFSAPLQGEYNSAKEVAQALDKAIIGNYQLMDSNHYAADAAVELAKPSATAEYFKSRSSGLEADEQQMLLENYANPVKMKQKMSV